MTLIRNVTDIDDKILENATATETWWALAYRVERLFTAAYDAIGVQPPTYEPRATANIAEMVALIETLIERGHAYQAEDGSASVYFNTASWPAYGELTRQQRDDMHDAEDSETVGKRDARDFALWKAHRDSEPLSASWPSPWGRGRPGWHIECSAMATRYLGETFDIHGGGLDLRFPHHENELAQSAAAGHGFARHWMHNGLVNTGGKKMSKSLGNSLFAADLLASARPIVLRYFLGSAHYRSVLDFSAESLDEAAAAFARVQGFLDRISIVAEQHHAQGAGAVAPMNGAATVADLPAAFANAMFDDFAVPQALAALHDTVRAGNTALDSDQVDEALQRGAEVAAMLDVLGLDPRASHWAAGGDGNGSDDALDSLVQVMIAERRAAREAKDFATSYLIRDRLAAAGVTL